MDNFLDRETMGKLAYDAYTLSSGTYASLTGYRHYADIDRVRAAFTRFCYENRDFAKWQDAWSAYWPGYEVPYPPMMMGREFSLDYILVTDAAEVRATLRGIGKADLTWPVSLFILMGDRAPEEVWAAPVEFHPYAQYTPVCRSL